MIQKQNSREYKIMKKSRKLRIERIVNARVELLQEEQRLNEVDWGKVWDTTKNVGRNVAGTAVQLGQGAPGQLYQFANDIYRGAQDVRRGKSVKDAIVGVGTDYLDRTQDQLDLVGMAPVIGAIPDLINVGISGARMYGNSIAGNVTDAKKHLGNMGISGLAAIPGYGQTATAGKILNKGVQGALSVAKAPAKSTKVAYKNQGPTQAGRGSLASDAYNKIKNWF
jgi:hypothetical protein